MNPGLRDLKHCGTDRAPLPAPVRSVLMLLAGAVLAYAVVADVPARRVIAPNDITMTEAEFQEVLEAARRDGMKAGIAQKQCRPVDQFLYPPRKS